MDMRMHMNDAAFALRRSAIREFSKLAGTVPGCVKLTLGEPDFDTPGVICNAAAEYRKRRDFVVGKLNSCGLETVTPEGTFYAFPSITRYGMDSFRFAERLVLEGGVAVTPGAAFGSDDHIRISYCCSMDALEEGMERLRRFISSLD